MPSTLRARLVAMLLLVLLAFTLMVGTASTLALRSQLTGQLDTKLTEAARRAAGPPPGTERLLGEMPLPEETPTDGTRTAPALGPEDRPLAPWLGQNAGTVLITDDGDDLARAGYLTGDNEFTELTQEQIDALSETPTDGRPHAVTIPGLGPYRAVNTTTDGETTLLALPTSDLTDTLTRYVAVAALIGAGGVVVAAAAGTWLVRRSLRPLDEVAGVAASATDVELSEGEVGAIPRVPGRHTDERTEVGKVGAALNRLIGHVEQALTARHDSESQVRQFVADASHELRTPLASVRGYAELAKRPGSDVDHALRRIEAEAERMGGLVNDLLLLARLDAGRPLERGPVDLVALAADAVSDAYAAGRDHRWELDLDGGRGDGRDAARRGGSDRTGPDEGDGEPPEAVVLGDEARLRQVFANLLGNARVHTPEGTRVVVSVRTRPSSTGATTSAGTSGSATTGGADGGAGRATVVVSVADDGPGIPADLRATLFQRFTRGDRARGRAQGSTGLGLAIVQAIVAAHGGSVRVDPSRTDGTTLELRIPLDETPPG
ncbi:sensor histidine kinase [Myceligenerans cantabricum]